LCARRADRPLRFGAEAYRLASGERREDAARLLVARRYVSSMYVSGEAAECMLRAIVGLRDRTFDERHDLRELCRRVGRLGMLTSPRDDEIVRDVQSIQAIWRNDLRFASSGQVDAFLRRINRNRFAGRRGLERGARDLYNAAAQVIARGEVIWHRSRTE